MTMMNTGMNVCDELHKSIHNLARYHFGDEVSEIPRDGVYFVFERGQSSHNGSRIVRIGSHTGDGKLAARLREHITKNKDRSIFRKNIGRALLHRAQDPFLADWELDLTTRKKRDLHSHRISKDKLASVEEEVSQFIRENLSFSVISCPSPEAALKLESLCIGTVSSCPSCTPTADWLGQSSPKIKIAESGLWQEMGLYKMGLQYSDIQTLFK